MYKKFNIDNLLILGGYFLYLKKYFKKFHYFVDLLYGNIYNN